MPDVFVSQPGRVSVIRGGTSLPGLVALRDSANTNRIITTSRVIVTGITYEQATHTQFQHTLLNTIYMYSFGDRIGNMTVSGLAFSTVSNQDGGACGSTDDNATLNSTIQTTGTTTDIQGRRIIQAGVNDVLDWYDRYKVSRSNNPIWIGIGRRNIQGFLLGSRVNQASVDYMTYAWNFTIAALPPQPVRA